MRRRVGWVVAAVLASVFVSVPVTASASTSPLRHRHSHTVSGPVQTYDAAAHTLTLKAKSGPIVLHVASDAKVWAGQEALPLDQLQSRTGVRATVTYTEKGGQKTTRTIRFEARKTP